MATDPNAIIYGTRNAGNEVQALVLGILEKAPVSESVRQKAIDSMFSEQAALMKPQPTDKWQFAGQLLTKLAVTEGATDKQLADFCRNAAQIAEVNRTGNFLFPAANGIADLGHRIGDAALAMGKRAGLVKPEMELAAVAAASRAIDSGNFPNPHGQRADISSATAGSLAGTVKDTIRLT